MTIYGIQAIPLHLIDPNPWQTRKGEDPQHVLELAKSILETHGVLQIPSGRRIEGDRVQLAFGHSRLAAYKLLVSQGQTDFSTFPVNLKLEMTDEEMAITAFTENEKRKDLNPVERANAIQAMLHDFGWTQQQVADKLTIDRSSVSNSLRMLRMPADVLNSIAVGCLPVRTAMALLPFYELTPLEITVLEQNYPDSDDFIALARSGQLNSDTVRQQVDKYMKLLHPDPEPIPEIPLVEPVRTKEILPEEENDHSTPKAGEAHNEESIRVDGDNLTEYPAEGTEEAPETQAQPTPHVVPVVERDDTKPTPPAAPQPTEPEPVVSSDTVLTVTWDVTGNAYVGLRRAGERFPTFTFKAGLKAADFPQLLADLEIE